jgi:TolB-like protein
LKRALPAYQGDDPYVFVSYSHRDESSAMAEVNWLQQHGINVWYDEGIAAGTEWREELAQSISGAAAFVYYVTPGSAASENCRKEVNFAVDRGKPIFAVHLEETTLPDGLDLAIADRQAILQHDVGQTEGRRKLLERLSETVDAQAPSPLPVPRSKNRLGWTTSAVFVVAVVVAAIVAVWRDDPGGDPETRLSVAVLPFETNGEVGRADPFSMGLQEAILGELNGLQQCGFVDCFDIRVASSAASTPFAGSSRDPREISEVLDVGYLLRGQVRHLGDQVQVSAELVRGSDATQLWSRRYDDVDDSSFDAQERLAVNIAHLTSNVMGFDVDDQIMLDLPAFQGVRPEAIAHFMDSMDQYRGAELEGAGSTQLRIQMLYRAIEADPEFPLPYIHLAALFGYRLGLPLEEARTIVWEALDKVEAIGRGNASIERAQAHFMLDLDYAAAERVVDETLSGSPRWEVYHHLWLAFIAMREGRKDDGFTHLRSVRSLQAGFEEGWVMGFTAWLYVIAGDYDRAITITDRGLIITEGNGIGRGLMRRSRLVAMYHLGRVDQAEQLFAEMRQSEKPVVTAAAHAWLGQPDRARQILEESRGQSLANRSFFEALAHVVLGDHDSAFEALESAVKDHEQLTIDSLRLWAYWDPLRDDLRFQGLLDLLDGLETNTDAYETARAIQSDRTTP